MNRGIDLLSLVGIRFVRRIRKVIFRNKYDLNFPFQILNIAIIITIFALYINYATSMSIYIYSISMLINHLANISRIFLKIGYERINQYVVYYVFQYIAQIFTLYSLLYLEKSDNDILYIANTSITIHVILFNMYCLYSWYLGSCSHVSNEHINRGLLVLASTMVNELRENTNPHLTEQQINTIPNISFNDSIHATMNCSICQDNFNMNETIKQLPCNHLFHSECIVTWLQMNNTCPNCRYVIPNN